MPRLLVVHHSPTPSVQALTDAVLAGTDDDAITGVEVVVRPALEAVRTTSWRPTATCSGPPRTSATWRGALKHFFDTIFLEAGGALTDDGSAGPAAGAQKPFGLWVHGRYDTTGAVRSVQSIVQALRWRQAAEVLEVIGDVDDDVRAAAYDLGGTLAALLDG